MRICCYLPSLLSSSVSEVTDTGDWIGLLAVLDSCVARLTLNDDNASDSDCDSSSVKQEKIKPRLNLLTM